MKLIVGLGNPGKQYQNTRHSVGFMVMDALTQKSKVKSQNFNLKFKSENKFKAEVCQLNPETILLKPLTYMNLSGEAVAKIANFYKIDPENIIIVHDDVDLELGRLKIQKGGGTAGHHGLESITKSLGTADFIRFRIGIGRPDGNKQILQMTNEQINKNLPATGGENLDFFAKSSKINQISKYTNKTRDYVLELFSAEEWLIMEKTINEVVGAIEYYLSNGLEKAMNKYN